MLGLVIVGVFMGLGAALVAGVQLVQRAIDDAAALDSIAGLAESTTRVHGAANQAVLVFATTPLHEARALRLAVAEARRTLEAFPAAIDAIEPTDTVLVSAAEQYVAAVVDIVDLAEAGLEPGSRQPNPATLETAHRVLIDAINDRRMVMRSALAASAAGSGPVTVAATALVILVLPTVAMFSFARSLRTPAPTPTTPRVTPTPVMPARLTTELEDRATAILDQARIVAWTRPTGQDAAPYRSLLSGAAGLRSVTRNLLAFDRLEAGDVLVSTEPTDLGELVERIRLGALDMGTTIAVVADDVEVLADAVRLHQSLENVVGIVAGHGALKVGLVVGREKGRGTVCVAGEGCTIPTEVLRALETDARPQRAGTLALAVARRLVAAMSGTLDHRQIEATTVFTFALPLAGARRR
jgi:hypothetical protein